MIPPMTPPTAEIIKTLLLPSVKSSFDENALPRDELPLFGMVGEV